ncbi:MAG: TIGR01458 family HAD-type hydrolase [Gammaproteobacteria bacterium]|nr:TIGR01458 family HAD-type hydrolase [Gammaproteobacteria bacterium]
MQADKARNALLIDLDGVIYQSEHLLDGALETLEWIGRKKIPHLYVTNTTSRSCAALLDKFQTLGFSATLKDLVTPAVAAAQWLQSRQLHKVALFVPEVTQADFGDIESVSLDREATVDAVVIGDLGEAWDYRLLNRAFRFLMQDPQPALIALGMTRYWRDQNGLRLDVAPFIKALEHAASCEALVLGKPAAAFFESSLAKLQCDAEQAFMIGDDIVGDIDAAQNCGIRGIQVRTGKFREADLDGPIKPYALLDSFADLPSWWRQAVDRTP